MAQVIIMMLRGIRVLTISTLTILSRIPKMPCPAGMFSVGGAVLNCTACRSGTACPFEASSPVACTGGKLIGVRTMSVKVLCCQYQR